MTTPMLQVTTYQCDNLNCDLFHSRSLTSPTTLVLRLPLPLHPHTRESSTHTRTHMLALAYFHMHTVRTFIHGYLVSHFFLVLVLGFQRPQPPRTHFAHTLRSHLLQLHRDAQAVKDAYRTTDQIVVHQGAHLPCLSSIDPPLMRPNEVCLSCTFS